MAIDLSHVLDDLTMAAAPTLVRDEEGGTVRCLACGHRCRIAEGKAGVCRMRFNRAGRLEVPAGYVAGLAIDPIEKKPFFHAFPGREALSFGMLGCNFHCEFCQNWISSQTFRDEDAVARPTAAQAEDIVQVAVERHVPVIVSTYNEPLITSEWAVEVFKLALPHGIACGFVSNGHATPEVIEFLRPYVKLYKVDLKCFDDHKYCRLGGQLATVLDSITRLKQAGFWVEVVTLLVPGFNDGEEEIGSIAKFVAGVSPDIPWHVTAFHPDYRMEGVSRTPGEALVKAYDIGRAAGLKFVYTGNLPGALGDRENTYCPACGTLLIRRQGFTIRKNTMRGSRCGKCNAEIPGIWEDVARAGSASYPTPVSL
jgi:pyruvate formate lyase activating enzyme